MLRPLLRRYYIRGLHRAGSILRILAGNSAVQDTGMGAKLRFQLSEPNELFSYFYFVDDLYIRTWQKYLRLGDAFIDVGANVGFYAGHIANYVGADGQVLAIEPNPAMIERLQNVIKINDISNMQLIARAASDGVYTTTLLIGTDHGLSRLKNSTNTVSGIEVANEKQVDTVAIDSLQSQFGGRKVRGIKLDIEGHEYLALRGAIETLTKHRPLVQMEFNPILMGQFGVTAGDLFTLFTGIDYVAKVPQSPRSLIFDKRRVQMREFTLAECASGFASDVWWCPRECEAELLAAWKTKLW